MTPRSTAVRGRAGGSVTGVRQALPMARESDLQRLAARQHGLASRTQLLELGFSPRQISTRATTGRWPRAAPRVYDVAPAARDSRRPLQAAVMAAAGRASHRSAAAILGFIEKAPMRPEILVMEGRLPAGIDATIHRTRHLPTGDCTTVDGIACTSAARTLLDLAGVVDEETLESAVCQAVVSGRITLPKLMRYVEADACTGRRGAGALRRLLCRYDDLRMVESRLEVIVMRAVRSGTFRAPTRQFALVLDGRTVRLDLAWPEERVFVEADGFGSHSNRAQFRRDRERQNALVLLGWLPLRYTWPVARAQPGRITDEVARALSSRGTRRSRT
jgi:very-short-patch-repair endonuclease